MNILFVHSNFPAQFRHLHRRLREDNEHNVVFLAEKKEWTAQESQKDKIITYQLNREQFGDVCHPNLRRFEKAVLTAQGGLRAAMKLNSKGYVPDLIIGHSGFGTTLYLKELWPTAKFIGYFEWYYRSSGSDVGFGNKESISPDNSSKIHTYNAPILMDFATCDRSITPTYWQRKQFPRKLREQIDVVFDGVDTDYFKPNRESKERLELDGKEISPEIPLVTYTTRGFEPYRGWPQVAEGISILMKRNPQVHVLLVGSDEVAYGCKRGDGRSWRQWAYEEYEYDESRLHFLAPLQYEEYKKVLQCSWIHIYWTIPFILSWGLIEAMSTGCTIVASNTDPVKEVITHGEEGIMVDFFNPDDMAARVDLLIKDQERRQELGRRARSRIINDRYDIESCLEKQMKIVNELMSK